MKNPHEHNCPWHGVDLNSDCVDELDGMPCLCSKQNIHTQKTLSEDKQFQEQLALEIKNRIAYQAKDAWTTYWLEHRDNYLDYTVEQLSKSGHEWRLNWMVENMAAQIARITATLTDLLGVANDLRALSKAKSRAEMEKIAGSLVQRDVLRKQAE